MIRTGADAHTKAYTGYYFDYIGSHRDRLGIGMQIYKSVVSEERLVPLAGISGPSGN